MKPDVPRSWSFEYLRRLALVLVSTVVALGVCEGALRLFSSEFAPYVSRSNQPCVYVEDSMLGYRYRSNATGWMRRNFEIDSAVKINSIGFHGPESDASAQRLPRILVVGDSLTAGLHVPASNTWTKVLESQRKEPAQVINVAIDGTGTDTHLMLAQQYVPVYRPDILVLAFYENDVGDMTRPKQYRECYKRAVLAYENHDQREQLRRYVDEQSPTRTSRWLFDHSYLFRLATKTIGSKNQVLLYSNFISPSRIGMSLPKRALRPHRLDERLSKFKELSDQYNFRLFIIPVPVKFSIAESIRVLRKHASAEVLQELQVIDVSNPLMSELASQNAAYEDLFWRFDGHFNERGHEVFGKVVARLLSEG